jgi:AcrR family transcriptional regulator
MPRAGLSEDRVVTAAELMADEVGLPKVTLAALAERFGVRQPSLYKHIESLAGLHRSISIRAKKELADVLARAAVGRSRQDAIQSVSHAYRTWALAHPGRYEALQRAPAQGDKEDEAVSAALITLFADCLAGYDLHADDAIDAIRALRSALHGFVTLEMGGAFRLPVDIDHSFDRLVSGLVLAIAGWTRQPEASAERP